MKTRDHGMIKKLYNCVQADTRAKKQPTYEDLMKMIEELNNKIKKLEDHNRIIFFDR